MTSPHPETGSDLPVFPGEPDRPGAKDRAAAVIPPRTLTIFLSWVVAGTLVIITAGRLLHLDDVLSWPYSGINAFAPVEYLPAYVALAAAFALRRNRLLVVSLLAVIAHLAFTVPELWPGRPEAVPAGAAKVRIMTSNLLYTNGDAGRLGAQITRARPDIVVLEEATPLTLDAVTKSGVLDGYAYREAHPRPDPFGVAVFSRFPLVQAELPMVADLPSLRMTVRVDATRQFRLFAVHTVSPTSRDYAARWRRQLDALRAEAALSPVPVVFAGDFNATRDHRPFARLLDERLRDAHDVAGAGWTPTWNANHLALPPLLRIDHVLASPQFAVTGYQVGDKIGSDHKPLVVDLALR
ncbi:endonuclease/exonuclease/phosphatase family protein [Protofrankia sp. BMG5.30]|uniref:endonuclease/exonuclease/phosphatase family protein n=1 Tax=Protofrankia sp. BMG5.30 TaxID=1834514 RepID=UPI00097650C5|nr:endonuclease/exonuclease/phosphatase family protein [Protofrankia sp. BMG5.30]ONH36357.1 endonuclease [Protofrankia sp. BMG5.30]